MALISSLYPDVFIEVDGVPDPIAEGMLVRTLRELCKVSQVWTYRSSVTTVADTQNYILLTPDDSVITSVKYADYDDNKLSILAPDQIDFDLFFETSGTPTIITTGEIDNEVLILRTPSEAKTLRFWLALQPSLDSTSFPDRILDQYYEIIIHGTVAKLLAQQNRKWFNPELAAFHFTKFEEGMYEARIHAADGDRIDTLRRTKYGGY